jgi:methylated-DNA-[protein]-cysteine S-methyltransferase
MFNSTEIKYYTFSVNAIRLVLSWSEHPFRVIRLKLDSDSGHFTDNQFISGTPDDSIIGETVCRIRSFLDGRIRMLPADYLDTKSLSPFAADILNTLRQTVSYGTTISYGKLAEYAGYPGAARAVGTVLKNNPFPLFFPCHRVIRNDGSFGMFQGSEEGTVIKKYLIDLEKRFAGTGGTLPEHKSSFSGNSKI